MTNPQDAAREAAYDKWWGTEEAGYSTDEPHVNFNAGYDAGRASRDAEIRERAGECSCGKSYGVHRRDEVGRLVHPDQLRAAEVARLVEALVRAGHRVIESIYRDLEWDTPKPEFEAFEGAVAAMFPIIGESATERALAPFTEERAQEVE